MKFIQHIFKWLLAKSGIVSKPEDQTTLKRPVPRPGKSENMYIWLKKYPNADLWSFNASLYNRDGWLFKYPKLEGTSSYGFKSYDDAEVEVRNAGYIPVKSDKIEIIDLDDT